MSTHARTTTFALTLTAAILASSAAHAFGGRLPNLCNFVKCEERSARTLADYNIQKESSAPGLGLKGNGSSNATNGTMAIRRLDAPRLTTPSGFGGLGGSAGRIR
jgi:hypothetical protein